MLVFSFHGTMATARDTREESDGIISLIRETADGLGKLIADHVKLARVELVSDARFYARDLAVMAGFGVVLFVGYILGWIAAGLAIGRAIHNTPLAFAAVAALHLIAGAIGVVVAAKRAKRVRLMHDTAEEVGRSVSALRGRELPARTV
jgi:uncharacterized membrane protein YqjE